MLRSWFIACRRLPAVQPSRQITPRCQHHSCLGYRASNHLADQGERVAAVFGQARRCSGTAEDEKRAAIARKKMLHQARTREDSLLADFLLGFAEARGNELRMQELQDWQKLMDCDDELLMNLVAGHEAPPPELDTAVLRKAKEYLAEHGPRDPYKAKW
eukprot:gnl/TRDRNA2_/TRDRNA2_28206_c0_seq2.p1 gnl/TRDRNA2_/TRDRNA2_28206_c0~~gnl/TRDRNA2_/TRDRNA2_28206_c0_seq2.p1  ORF type:complete len:159 (+),score=25.84 gnl/TRDRNA2_/TRDRNA2_28206_c0_seq2:47-523(+)